MMLERPTIIAEDYHGTYARNPTLNSEEQKEFISLPYWDEAMDRAAKPLLEMAPWEWIKPVGSEFGKKPTSILTTWQNFLDNMGIDPGTRDRALIMIDDYYRRQFGDEYTKVLDTPEDLDQIKNSVSYQLYRQDSDYYLGRWVPEDKEREGLKILASQSHKVIIVSGLYFELESAFKSRFQENSDWQVLVNTKPQMLPPAILRAGSVYNPLEPIRIPPPPYRRNHLGMNIVYPDNSYYKFLSNILLKNVADHLGMDYVVVDDDMENIRALSQAGFKVHTPVKIANYRKYFSSLPLEDFSDLIASYDGFSSGLGKLAGIDTPPSGYNTQHFQIPCI